MENGEIRKVRGDYKTRQGITQEPLADIEFVRKCYDWKTIIFLIYDLYFQPLLFFTYGYTLLIGL